MRNLHEHRRCKSLGFAVAIAYSFASFKGNDEHKLESILSCCLDKSWTGARTVAEAL